MGSSACGTLVEVDSFNSFVVLKSLHAHSDVFTAERNSQPSELILRYVSFPGFGRWLVWLTYVVIRQQLVD